MRTAILPQVVLLAASSSLGGAFVSPGLSSQTPLTSPMRPLSPTTVTVASSSSSSSSSSSTTAEPTLLDKAVDMLTPEDSRSKLKRALLNTLGEGQPLDTVLACPSSLRPLITKTKLVGPFSAISYKVCPQFGTKYTINGVYTDLTPQDPSKARPFWRLSAREVGSQELFRNERGWRQNFNAAGFPGIDKEYEELMRFLGLSPMPTTTPARDVIVDMSCGSGLMTRRLVQSGAFARVIGADYSETMLEETKLRFASSGIEVPELVRADAARMPFLSDSLDVMHAGAALHCWPKLEESLREVHRVLKPGGKFFATTFEIQGPYRSNRSMRFFQLDELRQLLITAGFDKDKVEVRREGTGCLIAKCEK